MVAQLCLQALRSIFVASYDFQGHGKDTRTRNHSGYKLVVIEVTLRPIVSRPISLGVRHPSGTRDQFYFLLEIFFRRLRVCNFVVPSLTRGRVCNLLYNYFWALPEQSLLARSPAELTALFYCLIWDSTNLEGQVPVFRSHVSAVRNFQYYHWEGYMGSMRCNVEFGYQLSKLK
jgi:hypothetical protein